MDLTVAVCTWNRASWLDRTLTRMRDLRVPPGLTWELLVVNNNCTDDTDAVLARHADALPLRRLFEPNQGLSHARNRAVSEARGQLVVWTDDDVLVEPDWLAAYAAAARAFPDAVYFGGPVEPWFEAAPPADLARHLPAVRAAFALVDYGPEMRPLAPDEAPFGANMAFRADVLASFRFDPRLGRTAARLIGDEETALLERLRAEGRQGVWVGPARVRHCIPAERATWAYVWRYYHGLGRTVTRRRGLPACPTLLGRPRWVVREYWTRRWTGWLLRQVGVSAWVGQYTRAAYLQGVLAEAADYRAAGGRGGSGFLVPPGSDS